MIQRWWNELANKYAHASPDQHIVMPNHFHGIVIIEGGPIPGGSVTTVLGCASVGRPCVAARGSSTAR